MIVAGWESFVIERILFRIIEKFVTLWYCTVRLVRRTEEEKYGTVRNGHLGSTDCYTLV